ncbi:hypothetical protein T484DRAFT_1939752 [Baffinella frigidus]|nr:hypothetical protein T484DRAFT_1939752 [Cryptophyta sp. CCMP2293]
MRALMRGVSGVILGVSARRRRVLGGPGRSPRFQTRFRRAVLRREHREGVLQAGVDGVLGGLLLHSRVGHRRSPGIQGVPSRVARRRKEHGGRGGASMIALERRPQGGRRSLQRLTAWSTPLLWSESYRAATFLTRLLARCCDPPQSAARTPLPKTSPHWKQATA